VSFSVESLFSVYTEMRRQASARKRTRSPVRWNHYIERWGLVFEASGIPRIAGRIWGALLTADPPHRTPEQLADLLGVSRASISTNSRLLLQSGLVERAVLPGSRHKALRVRDDAYESLMQEKLAATIKWRELADEGIELATDNTAAAPVALLELSEFYHFIEREQRAMMKRWRERRAGR
jgi:DNA-binding transcriptional regulator GbsR (MarR family)